MTAAETLYTISSDLLAKAAAALDPARTGHAAPARQYVSWGDPPMDVGCPDGLLAVALHPQQSVQRRNISPRTGTTSSRQKGVVLVARPRIWVGRCWPSAQAGTSAPAPADLSAASKVLMEDAWCLLRYVNQQRTAGTLFSGGYRAQEIGVGDIVTLPPSGGVAGFSLLVEVAVGDAAP